MTGPSLLIFWTAGADDGATALAVTFLDVDDSMAEEGFEPPVILGRISTAVEKPVMLTLEETLALPAALAVAGLFAIVCQALSRILEALPRTVTLCTKCRVRSLMEHSHRCGVKEGAHSTAERFGMFCDHVFDDCFDAGNILPE
jgi:hypothetical protein